MMLYTNEIVFRGHPDKVCDQISDALLDEYIRGDKMSRCGIEVVGGKGKIFVTGEVTTKANVNVEKVVKRVLKDIGYSREYEIINNIGVQSTDIALGTNENVLGAGDQGMMFGFACRDTKEMLPTAMVILQKFSRAYDEKSHEEPEVFFPDGKAQITGYYDDNKKLKKIKTFTVSYNNCETKRDYSDKWIKDTCKKICAEYKIEIEEFLINPTGKFLIGGFEGDAGLTGRKIVVDAYQSFANVGGGAFSGKDPTKVDRTAAYKAREIAKDYLQKYELDWCEVQLSYAIGIKKPLAIYITSNKGNLETPDSLYEECTPYNIIKDLNLRNICYEEKARYGHFVD